MGNHEVNVLYYYKHVTLYEVMYFASESRVYDDSSVLNKQLFACHGAHQLT